MITNQRFLFSPGILGTHNRDPAKDPRIPVSDQTDFLAEIFLKKYGHFLAGNKGVDYAAACCHALCCLLLWISNVYIYIFIYICISAVRSLWPSTMVSCFFCFAWLFQAIVHIHIHLQKQKQIQIRVRVRVRLCVCLRVCVCVLCGAAPCRGSLSFVVFCSVVLCCCVLLRQSSVTLGFWGERQTEPTHSWFPRQFPSR